MSKRLTFQSFPGAFMSAIVEAWGDEPGYTPSIEHMSGALCFTHDDPRFPLLYATPGWEHDPAERVVLQLSDGDSAESIEDELIPCAIELRVATPEAYIAAVRPIVDALAARMAEAFPR